MLQWLLIVEPEGLPSVFPIGFSTANAANCPLSPGVLNQKNLLK
jgi:hypothetical protein